MTPSRFLFVPLGLALALPAARGQEAGDAAVGGAAGKATEPVAETTESEEPRLEIRSGYGGVVPGRPAQAPQGKIPARPTLTWIGFQPLDGGAARVFVQLSARVAYEQRVVGDELVVTVSEVAPGAKNHLRPLETQYFDTALASIRAERLRRKGRRGRAGGVEIHVKFKGKPREADARIEKAPDGYHYLYLDFPPPQG